MGKVKKRNRRKALVREADRVFSEYIRLLDGRCVTCGSVDRLQCGHLFSRTSYSTRWDERNAYTQCASCNLRHEYDPGPLTSYFLSIYSKEDYDRLHEKYRTVKKFTEDDLMAIIEKNKKQIEEIRYGRLKENGYR